jgi:ribosomal protein S18 acetylase RimI-like enzyme
MKLSDFHKMLALWKSSPGIEVDEDDEKRNLRIYLRRNPGLCYVACDEKKLVGTVKCGQDGRRGYLFHLAVHEDYRKKGIAKALISKSLLNLRRQGIRKCNCYVFDSNKSALNFWRHNGWKPF